MCIEEPIEQHGTGQRHRDESHPTQGKDGSPGPDTRQPLPPCLRVEAPDDPKMQANREELEIEEDHGTKTVRTPRPAISFFAGNKS
jgi:hypothetical protein